jgi:hypothetical protein
VYEYAQLYKRTRCPPVVRVADTENISERVDKQLEALEAARQSNTLSTSSLNMQELHRFLDYHISQTDPHERPVSTFFGLPWPTSSLTPPEPALQVPDPVTRRLKEASLQRQRRGSLAGAEANATGAATKFWQVDGTPVQLQHKEGKDTDIGWFYPNIGEKQAQKMLFYLTRRLSDSELKYDWKMRFRVVPRVTADATNAGWFWEPWRVFSQSSHSLVEGPNRSWRFRGVDLGDTFIKPALRAEFATDVTAKEQALAAFLNFVKGSHVDMACLHVEAIGTQADQPPVTISVVPVPFLTHTAKRTFASQLFGPKYQKFLDEHRGKLRLILGKMDGQPRASTISQAQDMSDHDVELEAEEAEEEAEEAEEADEADDQDLYFPDEGFEYE